jgi:enoyl-CoA hydratase
VTQPTFDTLLYDLDAEGVLTITLNRPDKLNALNAQVLGDLFEAFEDARHDEAVRGVILTGAGDRAFAAGADIKKFVDLDPVSGQRFAAFGQRVFDAIESMPKPVVAAVNGFALGGGCELAMACHLRVASETARFGQPEVNLGLIPGLRRHAASASAGWPRRGHRDDSHGRADQGAARVRGGPRQSRHGS